MHIYIKIYIYTYVGASQDASDEPSDESNTEVDDFLSPLKANGSYGSESASGRAIYIHIFVYIYIYICIYIYTYTHICIYKCMYSYLMVQNPLQVSCKFNCHAYILEHAMPIKTFRSGIKQIIIIIMNIYLRMNIYVNMCNHIYVSGKSGFLRPKLKKQESRGSFHQGLSIREIEILNCSPAIGELESPQYKTFKKEFSFNQE
jgi:hypothetical protein